MRAGSTRRPLTAAVVQLDDLFERRGGPARLPGLERIFGDATRLEIDFWQMGLSPNS